MSSPSASFRGPTEAEVLELAEHHDSPSSHNAETSLPSPACLQEVEVKGGSLQFDASLSSKAPGEDESTSVKL